MAVAAAAAATVGRKHLCVHGSGRTGEAQTKMTVGIVFSPSAYCGRFVWLGPKLKLFIFLCFFLLYGPR